MSEKDNQTIKASGLPSSSIDLLDRRPSPEREAWTPEQRADAIIHVLYDNEPISQRGELRDTIAAEIREAVEVERLACFRIASDYDTEGFCSDGKKVARHVGHLIRNR